MFASSSSRSAFDVLMASSKSQSASRKRKTPSTMQTPNYCLNASKYRTQNFVVAATDTDYDADTGLVAVKKPSPDESVTELEKKAAYFDVNRAAYWGEGEQAEDSDGDTPDDLLAVTYLLVNRIAPAHKGLELGVGETLIIKVLAEAYGAKIAHIKKQNKHHGDLGLVAKNYRSSQPLLRKPERLTVSKVLDTFRLIAKDSGKYCEKKKMNHIKALLVAATDCESQYLVRMLLKKLRIGSGEETVNCALGHAAVYSGKHSTHAKAAGSLEDAAKIVKQVYSVFPVYDEIIPALLSGGVWDLPATCSFSLGIPVGPMLAKATTGVSEIVEKFQGMEFTCEYKYDGEHAQIHYMENGSVEIYSRNAERNTGKFPDVVASISRLKKPSTASFIVDCDLVACDRESQSILPFQVLRKRALKNVAMNKIKVNVCIFAFDILYLNGQPLMQEQLNVRREHLYKSFQEDPGFFQFATAITSNDLRRFNSFLTTPLILVFVIH